MKHLTLLVLLLSAGPVLGATCAHVETGQALDVQPCTTTADYLRRYTPEVTVNWVSTVVPNGTLHNAKLNPDGSYTNPVVIAPPAPHVVFVTDFKKRFTLAEKVAITQSADVTIKVFWDELNTTQTVDLNDNDTIGGVDYLVSVNLLTAQRAAAILSP